MIYRKWSMLTGTIAVTGGAAASVFVADLLFFRSGLFTKTEPRKGETVAATR